MPSVPSSHAKCALYCRTSESRFVGSSPGSQSALSTVPGLCTRHATFAWAHTGPFWPFTRRLPFSTSGRSTQTFAPSLATK
jgi:hypothetical protein